MICEQFASNSTNFNFFKFLELLCCAKELRNCVQPFPELEKGFLEWYILDLLLPVNITYYFGGLKHEITIQCKS